MISNKIKLFSSNKFNIDINSLKNDLNNLFKNTDIDITNILKQENKNTRTRKLSFRDVTPKITKFTPP